MAGFLGKAMSDPGYLQGVTLGHANSVATAVPEDHTQTLTERKIWMLLRTKAKSFAALYVASVEGEGRGTVGWHVSWGRVTLVLAWSMPAWRKWRLCVEEGEGIESSVWGLNHSVLQLHSRHFVTCIIVVHLNSVRVNVSSVRSNYHSIVPPNNLVQLLLGIWSQHKSSYIRGSCWNVKNQLNLKK